MELLNEEMEKEIVLIVDDEEFVRSSLRRILVWEKYLVIEAASGEEAIKLFQIHDISVAIVDQTMPGMKGTELLEWMKNNSPLTVRLMLTADPNGSVAQSAINKGEVFRFLSKPMDKSELLKVIKESLNRYRHSFQSRSKAKSIEKREEAVRLMMSQVQKTMQQTKSRDEKERLNKAAVLMTLSETVEAYDKYTRGHQARVAEISSVLAGDMGLSQTERESIKMAATLHDIGKIGISKEILLQEGVLDADMWERMKLHPEIGAKILEPVDYEWKIKDIVHQHHERYDGGGYPAGLKGNEIVVGARILNIADAFDAMNSDRHYRKALTTTQIIRELEINKAKQFDPSIAGKMIEIVKKGDLADKLYQITSINNSGVYSMKHTSL